MCSPITAMATTREAMGIHMDIMDTMAEDLAQVCAHL